MYRRELVLKMLDSFNFTTPEQRENVLPSMQQRMDASLSVAIDDLLRPFTKAELTDFEQRERHIRGGSDIALEFFITDRRAKLERVKTPEERVTVVFMGTLWGIGQDDKWLGVTFDQKEHAEIYRRGLIETLKEKN